MLIKICEYYLLLPWILATDLVDRSIAEIAVANFGKFPIVIFDLEIIMKRG